MKIYTSNFANSKKIPEDIVRISICAKPPKGYTGLEYKKVAPTYSILMSWKENKDNVLYIKRFNTEVLNKITPEEVYNSLLSLTGGKDCVLLCYEKAEDFCHRHLVRQWLNDNLNLGIIEYIFSKKAS